MSMGDKPLRWRDGFVLLPVIDQQSALTVSKALLHLSQSNAMLGL